MGTRQLVASLVLLSSATVAAAAEPAAPPVHKAIERSLGFLVEEGTGWMKTRKCASCHHAPLMLWALQEAKGRGYAFDRSALAEVTAWVLAEDDRAKVLPKPAAKPQGLSNSLLGAAAGAAASRVSIPKVLSQAPLFLALGLRPATGDAATLRGLKRFVAPVLAQQAADGTWGLAGGRPPLVDSREVMTLWTVLSLAPASREAAIDPVWQMSRERALKWLGNQPAGESHQAIVLRLLVQESARDRESLMGRLLARQNADGGWSQSPDRGSDAYATGQTLYVLGRGKGHEIQIRRAQEYLLKTQAADGSWEVKPRPDKPGGKASKKTEPISYVGTAWAALGLMATSPGP